MNDLLNAQITHIDSLNENRRKDFKVLNEYDYSNENFALLGVIIERASGMTYAAYIEKNIFEPLDMKNSFADIQKLTAYQNKAIGYTYKDDEGDFIDGIRRANHKMVSNFIDPFGGIYSNCSDLYTFFKAINNHTIITKQTQELLFKKHTDKYENEGVSHHYGYGFSITQQGGSVFTIGHGGVFPGVGSRFEYYPEKDYYVIVLSNYGSMSGSVIAGYIKDLIAPNN